MLIVKEGKKRIFNNLPHQDLTHTTFLKPNLQPKCVFTEVCFSHGHVIVAYSLPARPGKLN